MELYARLLRDNFNKKNNDEILVNLYVTLIFLNGNNYSLDKIPTNPEVEKWVIGIEKRRDVYSFRSRMAYSQDVINNLSNIGFFEDFEEKIEYNNKNKILPDIEGIEKIECLNCGTMNNADTNTAEFDIQIQVTFIKNAEEGGGSL